MQRNEFKIEVCAYSVEIAEAAVEAGADRVELCVAGAEGGLTPSYGLIRRAKTRLPQGVHVLIRPRSGLFTYTEAEKEEMLYDIEQAQALGADGLVVGALTGTGDIDWEWVRRCRRYTDAGCSLTFHRAFDFCRAPLESVCGLEDEGFDRILTSGAAASAPQGAALLKACVEKARRLQIMPGGGISPENIAGLARACGAREFHFSAARPDPHTAEALGMGVPNVPYPEKVRQAIAALSATVLPSQSCNRS
ncbi:MAG: copper homeostasis protein CutC [Bacteroidales bacterium]|nr:copper homeostasis protein CutC [Bacteroidales bacterium]